MNVFVTVYTADW